MAPLGDAVGLVHRHQRNGELLHQLAEAFGLQPLGRHIHNLVSPRGNLAVGIVQLPDGERAVQQCGRNPDLVQSVSLILHQRNQRGNHQGNAGQHGRRQLVADGLPCSRRHNPQDILSPEDALHQLFLAFLEGIVAEMLF
ncbi:hypothetical protein D3C75_717770 [compost metagenome]